MSRSDIGNHLGIAEETVCRIFARFQEDGLMSSQYRRVKLNDLERLKQIACHRRTGNARDSLDRQLEA
jgi:CRP/FNR family transcriptional regulator